MSLSCRSSAFFGLGALSVALGCSASNETPTSVGGAGGVASAAGLSGGGAAGTAQAQAGVGGVVAGAGAASGGSSGSAGSAVGGEVPATFATIKSLIPTSCFGGVCHDLPEHPLNLKVDDKLYATLTTHVTETCGPLVKAGSPQDSALVKLLKGPCNGTDRMPMGKCFADGDEGCVPPAYVAAIEQWIAKGAPQ